MKKIFLIIMYLLSILALGFAVFQSFKGESATMMIILGAFLLIVSALLHRMFIKDKKK